VRDLAERGADVDRDAAARHLFAPAGLRDLERVAHDLVQIDRDERLVAADARELLEPAHGLRAVERRALDHLQPLAQARVLDPLQEELRAAEDRREQVVEVVRDARGHLAERAQLLRAHELVLGGRQLAERPRALLVETRGAQRQRGEVRDVPEQPLVGVGVRALEVADGDRAEHVVARLHGHPEPVGVAQAVADRLHAAPRALVRVVRRPECRAFLEDELHEPDAVQRVAMRRIVVPGAGDDPEGDDDVAHILVAHEHDHVPHVHHAREVRVDGLDERGAVELARHGAREVVEGRELLHLAPVLAEQARVLHGHADLARQRFEQHQLGLRHVARGVPPHARERADHALLRHDRDEDLALVRQRAHEVRQPGVVLAEDGDRGPPALHRVRVEPVLHHRYADRAELREALLRHVVGGERLEPLAVGRDRPERHGVDAERARGLAHEVAQHRLEIQRRRERAADGQQRLRLAQLAPRAAGELRVLERETDLRRHTFDERDLGGGERASGLPPHQHEAAHRLALRERRHEEDGVRREAVEPRRVEPRIVQRIGAPERAAHGERVGDEREARDLQAAALEPRDEVGGDVVAGEHDERVLRLVHEARAHRVGRRRAPELARHAPHDLLGRARLRERLGHGEQRLRLAQALLHLGVEPDVLQRQRERARDRHREVALPVLEPRGALAVVEAEKADHLVLAHERHGHPGLDAEPLDPLRGEQIGLARVVNHHGPARVDHALMARHLPPAPRRAALVARPHLRPRAAVRELRHERRHAGTVPAMHGAAIHAADLRDANGHALEELPDVERRVQDLRPVEQRARLVEPARGLREEARVIERQRRLRGERAQECFRLGRDGHCRRAVDREDAQHALADDDRVDEPEAQAVRLELLAQARHDAGVLVARPEERLAVRGHPAHAPLADRHLAGELSGEVATAEDERPDDAAVSLVHHPHAHPRRVEEARRGRGDVLQHFVRVQRRRDQAVDLVERAQPLGELAGLAVEPRVADGDGRVVGEAREHRLVLVGEAAERPVVGLEHALDPAVDDDGHGHRGDDPLHVDDGLVRPLDARIIAIVRGAERPAGDERHAAHALARLDPQRLERVRSVPDARAGQRFRRPVLAEENARHVAGAEVARARAHALEHRGEIERGVDRAGDLGEDLGLAAAAVRLGVERGVADGRGRLREEALEQLVVVGAQPERLAARERHHGEHRVVVDDRYGEEAADLVIAQPFAVADRRVGREDVGHVDLDALLGRLPAAPSP